MSQHIKKPLQVAAPHTEACVESSPGRQAQFWTLAPVSKYTNTPVIELKQVKQDADSL